MENIRNFAIIAHIDHGKSTLADRFLELTGTVGKKHEAQMLDKNPISRERGITIKLAPVRMTYVMRKSKAQSLKSNINPNDQYLKNLEIRNLDLEIEGSKFILNLIDTPGHVDFSYEVERTLACVEGVILLVDATQGIQAQTIAHTYKAIEQNLVIIAAINKIDSPYAKIEETKTELAEFLGVAQEGIFEISAKTGQGMEELLSEVIKTVPSPTLSQDDDNNSARGLIFDSYYDAYRGVIAFIRVFDGKFAPGEKLKLHATNIQFEAVEMGIFRPDLTKKETLFAGEIGYVATGLKDIHKVQVGDTLSSLNVIHALPGYRKVNPVVFASLYPTDPQQFISLKTALEKLTLSDSSLTAEGIYSKALGSGFRVGFLGVLHADIVRERLEREFDLSIVLTSPTVEYHKIDVGGKSLLEEPIAEVTIVTPQQYVGAIMTLSEEARGKFLSMDNKGRTIIQYEIPLSEIVSHFFENLKNVSSGYASFDWQLKRYQSVDADKLAILLNDEIIEEFSDYVVSSLAQSRGYELTNRLKELIPRQQYEVKIQASYKGKIIASARITPFRKDVTSKLYGGDRTRKDKLLKKQKKGKKLLKSVGKVEIPKEVFLKVFQQGN